MVGLYTGGLIHGGLIYGGLIVGALRYSTITFSTLYFSQAFSAAVDHSLQLSEALEEVHPLRLNNIGIMFTLFS